MENKNLYKSAFEKVQMPDERKDEIRNMVKEEALYTGDATRAFNKTHIWLAAAAAIIIAILVIPQTREMTYAAARYIKSVFTMKSGLSVEFSTEEENGESHSSVGVTYNSSLNKSGYLNSKDERLYFIIDGNKEDITDKCSETDYYKYSYDIGNGGKSVIYAGGTVENNGWIELSYNEKGKLISKTFSAKAQNTTWGEKALSDAGVPKTPAINGTEETDEEHVVEIYIDE